MDDLHRLLVEAAERAAGQARPPGAAVALRQARNRRRMAAVTACAVLVGVTVASIGLSRGWLQRPTIAPISKPPVTTLPDDRPWRSLRPKDWSSLVPDEHPVAPILAAAKGAQAGLPWRLTVYRSVLQPTGQAPKHDVCYMLEWFADQEARDQLQVNGTCSLATQTSTVLAVNGPRTGRTAVIGRAPQAAIRIRLELRGQEPVETTTVSTTPDLGGRFYIAFVPPTAYLERMVALDGAGHQIGQAPGQGNLTNRWTDRGSYPIPFSGVHAPTGPVRVVLRSTRVTVAVWPTRFGYCLASADNRTNGTATDCSPATSTSFDPQPFCQPRNSGAKLGGEAWLVSAVPGAARTVRVEVAGERFSVAVHDAGPGFDQSLFLAELPVRKGVTTVRLTALDASSQPVRIWTTTYSC